MPTFDMILLIGAACGLIMVLGSLLLLWKGAITLQEASSKDALDVRILDQVKISTRYPALGLFTIGLLFVLMSAYFSQPQEVKRFKLSGKVTAEGATAFNKVVTIEVVAGPWTIKPLSSGQVDVPIYPNLDSLMITIRAPGYEHGARTYSVELKDKLQGSFGTVDIGKVTRKAPKKGTIVKAPGRGERPGGLPKY